MKYPDVRKGKALQVGLMALLLGFSSCDNTKEAKTVADRFYTLLETAQFEQALQLVHPEAFVSPTPQANGKTLWLHLLEEKQKTYGHPVSFFNTDFKNKPDGKKEQKIMLKFEVQYEKQKLFELLVFQPYQQHLRISEYQFSEKEEELAIKWNNF